MHAHTNSQASLQPTVTQGSGSTYGQQTPQATSPVSQMGQTPPLA